MLTGVLCIGGAALGVTFGYRAQERARRAAQIEGQAVRFTQVQTIAISVPIAVHPDALGVGRVRGRIALTTIPGAGDYAEAVAQARIAIDHALTAEERAWGLPLDPPPLPPSEVTFPLAIRWLVYDDVAVRAFLVEEVTRRARGIPFSVSTIEPRRVDPTADPHLFTLSTVVTISVNTLIPVDGVP
jgi:hypothetical protein